ncbi:MAG: YraN family protein [Lachnospiraceae bacterium]|nr:YraN family protein [Lachnospiraceae bacterium]
MNKRKTGAQWEKMASSYLIAHGMRIVASNFRCRQGEIDLVGYHENYLVFVEVKYRSNHRNGFALEAVDYRKQYKICRVAEYYRYIHKIGDGIGVRYDVVGIQEGKIEWMKNAFSHIDSHNSNRY